MNKRFISLILSFAIVSAGLMGCQNNKKESNIVEKANNNIETTEIVQEPQSTDEIESLDNIDTIPKMSEENCRNLAYAEIIEAYINYDSYGALLENQYLSNLDTVMEGNFFFIADINADDKDELVVTIDDTSMAMMSTNIYGYDTEKGEAFLYDTNFWVGLTFYDNGIIKEDVSHAQGFRGEYLWPYSLYKYNAETKGYDCIGGASCWERDYYPDEFPVEADKDGDGIVYSFGTDDDNMWFDETDYKQWFDETLAGAHKVDYEEKIIYEQSVKYLLKPYYMELTSILEQLQGDGKIDIGSVYINYILKYLNGNTSPERLEIIPNVVFSYDENDNVYYGELNNKKFMRYEVGEWGTFVYFNKEENYKLLGIQIDDTLESAEEKLYQLGFKKGQIDMYNPIYVNANYNSFAIEIRSQSGVVKEISIKYISQ